MIFPVVAPDPLFQGAEIQSVFVAHALGVASVLLQAALLASVLLIALWRWGAAFPAGAFTVVFGLNAVAVGVARDQFAPWSRGDAPREPHGAERHENEILTMMTH